MSYISRESLKAAFEEDGHLSAYVEEMIDDVPAADVRPLVRGKWTSTGAGHLTSKCSACGHKSLESGNFCPNCGAEMEG